MAIGTLRALFGRLVGRSGAVGDAAQAADAPTAHAQLLDSVVASLPDAAIVLDRGGRVVTFNTAARTIAPALTRAAQASLALRVPEVVEAVRDVAATNEPRSVEFAQRVPVDRWFMAHVRSLSGEGTGLILL